MIPFGNSSYVRVIEPILFIDLLGRGSRGSTISEGGQGDPLQGEAKDGKWKEAERLA
jgi:hypothetical protein